MRFTFFTAQTANGQSSPATMDGGPSNLRVNGTFNGATLTFTCKDPVSGSWDPIANGVITAAGVYTIALAPGSQVRAELTNAGGSTSLNASLG